VEITFILNTGRCGSTLLSRILERHPEVLSMSEFFWSLWMEPEDIRLGDQNGRDFWDLLSAPQPYLDAMIREGFAISELCYPYGLGRFDLFTGVPRISHITLPRLTADPDTLFDNLGAEVPAWPTRPAASQFRALFSFLAGRFGRRTVVERTGGSLYYAGLLHQLFPDAKFVHMHRDGPDCALSMSRHPGARVLGLAEQASLVDELREDVAALLTPPLDVKSIMGYPAPPPEVYGRLWSRMIVSGLSLLRRLPSSSWIALGYEDLLRDPERELARLAKFMGVRPEQEWIATARTMIDPSRVGRSAELAPGDLAALRSACEPGRRAIESRAGAVVED
jgi:hypothetical protein